MKKYKCHKEVFAFKIKNIVKQDKLFYYLTDEDNKFYKVTVEYINKHKPYSGGYYVKYKDGYQSFSPADAFEEGYTLICL